MSGIDEQEFDFEQDMVPDTSDAASKDADAAASQPANRETTEPETLDLVREAVTDKPEAVAASQAETGTEKQEDEHDEPGRPPEDDDFSDLPFNRHPRFRQLYSRWKRAEVDAGRYRNVQGFLDAQGLTAEETANGLTIMALMKHNPVEAVRQLRPTLQRLFLAAGEMLPQDLHQRVAAGELPPDLALEISRNRAQTESMVMHQSFAEQQRQRQQQNDMTEALISAAVTWEDNRRVRDPNFDAKIEPLRKELAYLHATEGKPTTTQGVVGQLRRAYEAVNATFQADAPAPTRPSARRPAMRPVTGGQIGGATRPATAMSTLDIIMAKTGA